VGKGGEKREVGGIAPWLLGDRRIWPGCICRGFKGVEHLDEMADTFMKSKKQLLRVNYT